MCLRQAAEHPNVVGQCSIAGVRKAGGVGKRRAILVFVLQP